MGGWVRGSIRLITQPPPHENHSLKRERSYIMYVFFIFLGNVNLAVCIQKMLNPETAKRNIPAML